MRNVLFKISLVVGLCLAAPAISQPASFCPDGWSCGKPVEHAAETRKTASRPDACLIHHALATEDGVWHLLLLLYSIDAGRDVHIGFGVNLMEKPASDNKFASVPLRSIRLLSADRALDTRKWKLDGADTTRIRVSIPVTEQIVEAVGASVGIASGEAYGLLAQTQDGRNVRIEARPVERAKQAILEFQACIEGRNKTSAK